MKHSWLRWLLGGIILGILFSFIGLYFFERVLTNRPTVLWVQNIGEHTVRIHGEKSWDNWCFVKYIDITNSKQGGALTPLPIDSFYSEHCPNTEKTPWTLTAGANTEQYPDFKLLTGITNGTTYQAYTFDHKTGRYELKPEQ